MTRCQITEIYPAFYEKWRNIGVDTFTKHSIFHDDQNFSVEILLIRKDLPIKATCVNVYEKIVLKGISFLLECFKKDVNKARVSLKFICLFFLIFTLWTL